MHMGLGNKTSNTSNVTSSSNVSKLEGYLNEFALSNLFEMLHSSGKTGILRLHYSDYRYNTKIAFMNGYIGRLKTNFAPKLARIMRGMGAEEEKITLLKKINAAGQKLSDTQDFELHQLVLESFRRRVDMALMPIFELQNGKFSFCFTDKTEIIVAPGVNPVAMSLDMARRVDELNNFSFRSKRWSLDDCFQVNTSPGIKLRDSTLTDSQVAVLEHLKEITNLADLCVYSQLVWDEMIYALISLEEANLIKHVNPTLDLDDKFQPIEIDKIKPNIMPNIFE